MDINRNWFITVTTYGTRLPGDERGFVGNHRPRPNKRTINNIFGTELDANVPRLNEYARDIMVADAVRLSVEQAYALLEQFQETTVYRSWCLWAVSIMANHFHAVIGVPGDPDPERIRGSLKSYGSRRLNQRWGERRNGTWWTKGGSNKKLPTEESLFSAIRYTIDQEYPLLIWTHAVPELNLPGGFVSPPAGESAVLADR